MKVWVPMLVYVFLQAFTPGPNNLTCLYLGGAYGLKGAKKFIIASMSALYIKTLLCGLLNVALSAVIPSLVKYLAWAGAAYMLYLALSMMLSGWREEGSGPAVRRESTYKDGIILQLLNGKSWVSSLSIFAVYVMPVSTEIGTMLAVTVPYIFLMACATLTWTVFGSALKSFISRHRKPFGVVMGLSLIWCAVTAVI